MKRLVKVGVLLAVMAVVMTGCNCYDKMTKKVGGVDATATPEVLVLKGQNVNADIKVVFPSNYFNKKAVMKVTPVLVFPEGEITGTPKFVQGEKVKDNYTVIPYAAGGSYTQTVAFPFDPRAVLSTLELRIEAKCGKDGEYRRIAAIAVAEGISTVQNNADWTGGMDLMPDNFKRVTTITESADLMYEVNSSKVRPVALNSSQIKLLEDFVKENKDKERTELGEVYARGYASPEGPTNLNTKLAQERSQTGKDVIGKKLAATGVSLDAAAYGEDWDGFKTLVEESNMKDKDIILQVLNMYNSPVQREQEIKNMSQVFDVLKTDILPQLRRTQLVASADITGKTDAEITAAARNNINSLNLEEMLYAATLTDNINDKARIYKAAADKFNDVRAYNNYGIALAKDGDLEGAKRAFNKANSIESSPEISNNLGVIALAEGNIEEARRYLAPLSGTDGQSGKALLALADGDYSSAARTLDGYNLAIAEFSNGNITRAKAALNDVDTASGDYLKAVIAMREGNSNSAVTLLKSAIAKDPSLRAKAKQDVEFAKLFGVQEFLSL